MGISIIDKTFISEFYKCPKKSYYENVERKKVYVPRLDKEERSKKTLLSPAVIKNKIKSKTLTYALVLLFKKNKILKKDFLNIYINIIDDVLGKEQRKNNRIKKDITALAFYEYNKIKKELLTETDILYRLLKYDYSDYEIKEHTVVGDINLTKFVNSQIEFLKKSYTNTKLELIKNDYYYRLRYPIILEHLMGFKHLVIKFTDNGSPFNAIEYNIDLLLTNHFFKRIVFQAELDHIEFYDTTNNNRTKYNTKKMKTMMASLEIYKILRQIENGLLMRSNDRRICKKCINKNICRNESSKIKKNNNNRLFEGGDFVETISRG